MRTETVHLPYGLVIVLTLDEDTCVGASVSLLSVEQKEPCAYCGEYECEFNCDLSQVAVSNAHEAGDVSLLDSIESDVRSRLRWNAAWDTLERFVVASACAGIDIGSSEFREAFTTVADGISNELGED